ncbi:hypothetical protein PACTADRAFT_39869 [Pachysolen tannophilus NRRL Y-2460]|uniref:3-methyl-2-oxobutanoate hydroxymethyltransferase n=1 Tax=Pachysolen tannophilus NRRL Y-2460 TaxID=669874 RepID=A0A1E4TXQ2_PACTA|nr:hypothetical protein PACTADRAFT_39869 [Pachysolen tannophilus NRRL Y-2460]
MFRNSVSKSVGYFSRLRKYSSHSQRVGQTTLSEIYNLYQNKVPLTCITAHDYITAKIADNASNIDMILIGDSLSMVSLGYNSTLEISFEEFYYLSKAVTRGVSKKFLICDLPYGSFESSTAQCIDNSIKLMKLGKIQSIKIEGSYEYEKEIKRLIDIGIPVTGHIGLKPQRFSKTSGFKVQGQALKDALEIYKEACFLNRLGVSLLVLECIPSKLAKFITENISVPTIGIGAGNSTSGQVLVQGDLLGCSESERIPKFLKQYENFYGKGLEALNKYGNEVKNREYPEKKHEYGIKDEVFQEFVKAAKDIKI